MKLASFFLAATVLLQAGPKVATIDIRKALTATTDGRAAVAELERRFGPAKQSLSDVELRIRILRAADDADQPALKGVCKLWRGAAASARNWPHISSRKHNRASSKT